MKKICAAIALTFALLAVSPTAEAQKFIPAAVEISKSVAEIDGRSFYVHTVEARQTLYSICKAYGADLDEVKEINAGRLTGGLKAGSLLLIPVAEKKAEEAPAPAVKETPSPATESKVSDSNAEAQPTGKYVLHRVKWYDSLLMLALKYKVSQEDIVAANNLDSKTLVVGQVLRIPLGGETDAEVDDNTMIEVPEDELFEEEKESESESSVSIVDPEDPEQDWNWKPVFVPFGGTANIALIIPIGSQLPSPSANFLDFYAGVLTAIDQQRKDGTNINLKVIDMTDFDSAEQLMKESKLDDFDFLIGNFSMENVEVPAHWCDTRHIPLISPLDQKVEAATYNHRYLINAPVSPSTQTMRMAESIGYRPGKDNVIVLCEKGDIQSKFYFDIIASLDSLEIPYTVVQAALGRGESVQTALVPGRRNHVIITSERESSAADALRSVGNLAKNDAYDISGYASHKIRKFESIDADMYQRANTHFVMGHYVDYEDEEVREFVNTFRDTYNAEPGNFAFQGYDIGMYFISALKRYGNDMINRLSLYPSDGLQLNFKFDRRTPTGGVFNEGTKNLLY